MLAKLQYALLQSLRNAGVMAWPFHALLQGPGVRFLWACSSPCVKRGTTNTAPPQQSLQGPGRGMVCVQPQSCSFS